MISLVFFDWKRTLYNPDSKNLIDGAIKLLDFLKNKKVPMILVGKGGEDMQFEVDRLRVREYFRKIIFTEGEKDPNAYIPDMLGGTKKALFIGDRVRSELEIGKNLGATTVWVKQGKFAKELPERSGQEPDYTVSSLMECLELLQKLFLI